MCNNASPFTGTCYDFFWWFLEYWGGGGVIVTSPCGPFSLSSTIAVLFHCFRYLKAEKDRSHGTDPIGMVSSRCGRFRECLGNNPSQPK